MEHTSDHVELDMANVRPTFSVSLFFCLYPTIKPEDLCVHAAPRMPSYIFKQMVDYIG